MASLPALLMILFTMPREGDSSVLIMLTTIITEMK